MQKRNMFSICKNENCSKKSSCARYVDEYDSDYMFVHLKNICNQETNYKYYILEELSLPTEEVKEEVK